jgi:hypothetical protein
VGRRIYHLNTIKYWYSYDQEEICALLKIHIQTIRDWIREGLQINRKPGVTLIYGNDLKEFLGKLNQSQKRPTKFDQMLCMSCKDAKVPFKKQICLEHANKLLKAKAVCRDCKKKMNRNYKLDDLPKLRKIFCVVDVLELYDSSNPSLKTHFLNQGEDRKNEPDNEPIQRDFFR